MTVSHNFREFGGKHIPITKVETNDFLGVFQALSENPRKYPAKLLRQIKEQVSLLVREQSPTRRLSVVDIDDDVDPSNIDVVYGVGLIENIGELGYKSISSDCIYKDIVRNNENWDSEKILQMLAPKISHKRNFIPLWKYMKESGRVNADGSFDSEHLDDSLSIVFSRNADDFSSTNYKYKKGSFSSDWDISRIVAEYGAKHCVHYITFLPTDRIDSSTLLKFLKDNIHMLEDQYGSYYRKLVCLYDWLEYGPGKVSAI